MPDTANTPLKLPPTQNLRWFDRRYPMGPGNIFVGFSLDTNVFRTLAKADFERTQKLIDSFTRREIRINFRLQLAENGLQP